MSNNGNGTKKLKKVQDKKANSIASQKPSILNIFINRIWNYVKYHTSYQHYQALLYQKHRREPTVDI